MLNSSARGQLACRLMLGLLILPFSAGCGVLTAKLAGNAANENAYRTHEARRLSLADASSMKTGAEGQQQSVAQKEPSVTGQQDAPETTQQPAIRTVQFKQDQAAPLRLPNPTDQAPDKIVEMVPLPKTVGTSFALPIDLPAALRLAGANNLQIAFAAERVNQAVARAAAAKILWVPSLRAGVVYNNHGGQIQATEGEVIDVNRSSLFAGAGAGVSGSPLNGGSGGPARMFVDLSPVDVLFEPLAARQVVRATQARQVATFNDTLLQTTAAYVSLLRAHALVAISKETVRNAESLSKITDDFARSGQGLQADADRARAELQSRRRDLLAVEEQAAVASAELARILRLDPATELVPAEAAPLPLQLIEHCGDVYGLIAQAMAVRPELASAGAGVQETWYRTRQEHWRPFLPHLYAGMSGGGFGGAPGSSIDNFNGRSDFDVAAIWQVENLGLGNRARLREQESLNRQAQITIDQVRDLIAAEVTQAYQRVQFRGQQIGTTQTQVQAAMEALRLNLDGTRGGVIRPIELQQAVGALAKARQQHLDAVLDYNLAQFELLRAIGTPPDPNAVDQPLP